MKVIKNLYSSFDNYLTRLGRSRVRDELLKSSDRILEDAGFSRALLESGVDAWPWHAATTETTVQSVKIDEKATAIQELESFSDRDLHDLGIARGSIIDAVMFGREGIEHDVERKAA